MEATSDSVLLQQLERLEARYKRLRRIMITLVCISPVIFFLVAADRQKPTKKTTVQELTLRSPDGKVRGWLGVTKDGKAVLKLHYPDGKVGLSFEVSKELSEIALFNKEGKRQQFMRVKGEDSQFALCDPSERPRVVMSLEKDVPQIIIKDKDQIERVQIKAAKDVAGFLLKDKKTPRIFFLVEKDRSELYLKPEGEKTRGVLLQALPDGAHFTLLENGKQKRAYLSLQDNGAVWGFLDRNEKIRSLFGVMKNQPVLYFADEKQKLIFKKP